MLTVAVPKRNKLPNIIVLTPKDGSDPARTLSARGIFLNLIIDTFLLLVFRVFARVKAISFMPFLV